MAQWAYDGTQDPEPPPMHGDPLSGLVTGTRYEPEAVTVRVVEAPPPDISEVQRRVRSVLGDDDLTEGATDDATGEAVETAATPAEIPAPAPAPAQESVPKKVAPAPPRAAAPLFNPAQVTTDRPKRSSSTTGIAVVLVLVAVMAAVGVVVIVSLVETIGSLFD